MSASNCNVLVNTNLTGMQKKEAYFKVLYQNMGIRITLTAGTETETNAENSNGA